MSPAQLFGWRRKALTLVHAEVSAQESTIGAVRFSRVEAPLGGGVVEIVVGAMVVRAEVGFDPDHLARVIRAVQQV
jgi:hypothetical protein